MINIIDIFIISFYFIFLGGSFVIPEVAFYEGEWKDSKNAVACRDILDGVILLFFLPS